MKEISKKLKTSNVIESNPDHDGDEGDDEITKHLGLLKNKRKNEINLNKSFVKKKKFK